MPHIIVAEHHSFWHSGGPRLEGKQHSNNCSLFLHCRQDLYINSTICSKLTDGMALPMGATHCVDDGAALVGLYLCLSLLQLRIRSSHP